MSRIPIVSALAKVAEDRWLAANKASFENWIIIVDESLEKQTEYTPVMYLPKQPWIPYYAGEVKVPQKMQTELDMFAYIRKYYHQRGWVFGDLNMHGDRVFSFIVFSDTPPASGS